MRTLPQIELNHIDGYAEFLAMGWDTIKETFDMMICPQFLATLANAKKLAQENGGYELRVANEVFSMSRKGTQSASYVFSNEDFRIFVRAPSMPWNISVEYSSRGLWMAGIDELRARIMDFFSQVMKPRGKLEEPNTWQRISRADFAFDLYSPDFSNEMKPEIMYNVVCHSAVKKKPHFKIECDSVGKGVFLETLTIGSKKSIQVQLYDKGKEIKEVSGKDWMLEIWEEQGYVPPKDKSHKDVWRLELRFGADYLKNRKILTFYDLQEGVQQLITEGLFTRRLCSTTSDSNRSRWPLHPFYVAAYRQLEQQIEFLPLGRIYTQGARIMAHRARQQIAGSIRSLVALKGDVLEPDEISAELERIIEQLWQDKDNYKKYEAATIRYADLQYFDLDEDKDYYGDSRGDETFTAILSGKSHKA